MFTETIVAASLHGRSHCPPMLVAQPDIGLLPDGAALGRRFKIKSADSPVRRESVGQLVRRRYLWRGYGELPLPKGQNPHQTTLTALDGELTIGTLSITLDGPQGLGVEQEFSEEVTQLRAQGLRLSEYTRFAIDPTQGTKRVLAALFHVAYILAHRIRGYDTALIEVNPRHVRYYERMLGARVVGAERMNRLVGAPAVLLAVDFNDVREQIGRLAGQPELAATERTLYPFAFPLAVEATIIEKLRSRQRSKSVSLS